MKYEESEVGRIDLTMDISTKPCNDRCSRVHRLRDSFGITRASPLVGIFRMFIVEMCNVGGAAVCMVVSYIGCFLNKRGLTGKIHQNENRYIPSNCF